MKPRTDAYRFSYNKNCPVGEATLAMLRWSIAENNKTSNHKLRVCVKGRLGKNNPNAAKYKTLAKQKWNAFQTIRLQDAAYFDVYVQAR